MEGGGPHYELLLCVGRPSAGNCRQLEESPLVERMPYRRALALGLLAAVALAASPNQDPAQSGDVALVSQARNVVAAMLTRLPNYTCLETLESTVRAVGQAKFRLLDRVRVEVAYVEGTELYAWPGSPKFDTRDIQQVIAGHGAVGTGDFGAHLRATYSGNIPLQLAGKDSIKGRDAWRFTQSVPLRLSRFDMIVPPAKATVAYDVTAWHDVANLALLRFELEATEFPDSIPVGHTFKATEYETVSVNGMPARLPAMTELSMTTRKGVESRTVSTFSNCHEYKGESKLIFEEAAGEQPGRTPQAPNMLYLPAGLEVQARLDETVELTQAARGDPLVMTVTKDVIKHGRKVLSAGAKLNGRWHYIGCNDRPVAYCFATLKTESYEDGAHSGPFAAALASPSLELDLAYGVRSFEQGRRLSIPPEISHPEQGTATLYAGIVTRLPRGYRLIWRTLEVSGGSKP